MTKYACYGRLRWRQANATCAFQKRNRPQTKAPRADCRLADAYGAGRHRAIHGARDCATGGPKRRARPCIPNGGLSAQGQDVVWRGERVAREPVRGSFPPAQMSDPPTSPRNGSLNNDGRPVRAAATPIRSGARGRNDWWTAAIRQLLPGLRAPREASPLGSTAQDAITSMTANSQDAPERRAGAVWMWQCGGVGQSG